NDGAFTKSTFDYDPFGLVATNVTSTAVNPNGSVPPAMSTSVTPDPVTLNITSTTDPNKTVWGASYDGFGRVLLSKVTPPGGAEAVLSSLTYNGFADGSTTGRNIVQKVFTDAVPVGTEGTAPGRIGTTYLDSLGRTIKTHVELGPDYQNQIMVIGEHTYDALGRVQFAADPRPSTDSFAAAYGTTFTFNADGTPACVIRGSGAQP